jgi:hypothetical protein
VHCSANHLYLLWVKVGRPLCLTTRTSSDAWLWHERYSHLHFDALSKIEQKGMVHDLPHINHIHRLCADCIATKMKRSLFPSLAKRRADGLLDLVHGDLCGPISSETPGGKKFFLVLVDDWSRFMWVAPLAAKSDMLAAVKMFKAKVEVETGRRLRLLRTDNRGELTSMSSRLTVPSMGSNGST